MPLCQNHFMTSSTSVFLSIPPVNYKRGGNVLLFTSQRRPRDVLNVCMSVWASPSVIPTPPTPRRHPGRRLLLLLPVFCFCEGS